MPPESIERALDQAVDDEMIEAARHDAKRAPFGTTRLPSITRLVMLLLCSRADRKRRNALDHVEPEAVKARDFRGLCVRRRMR